MMASASQILVALNRLDVELKAEGGRILYRPVEAVSAELLADIKDHKSEILDLLNGEAVSAIVANVPWDELPKPLACPVCGETVLDCWWDGLGRQRCRRCDPPLAAKGSGPRNRKGRTEIG